MEQHDPSRRQYVPHSYQTQQSQQGVAPAPDQFATPGSVERFRQSTYLQESPSSAQTTARAGGETQQQVYGFAQGLQYGAGAQLHPSQMQYGQDIQTPETPRQQTQQYGQYGSNVVYGIAQPQTGPSPYEQAPQYRSRASTASETLATQFGVPQTAQYYLAGQPGPTSASAPELPSQHIPSPYAQSNTYAPVGPSSAQSYTGGIMDPSQSSAYTPYVQQSPYPTQQQSQTVDQAFEQYQNQVRNIFMLARDGTLGSIDSPLLQITQYLLGNVESLGLTRDDEALHDQRINLWDEFNRAWLVTLQRQYDLAEEMIRTGPLRDGQSIMTSQALDRLGQELVRLCDSVERHGLVDYQVGVAEEEIMDLLLRCLSLLDPVSERSGELDSQQESSVVGVMRGR